MARKPTKTTIQPDQHELFAQVRARFADIGALGTTSLGLTFAFSVPFFLALFSMVEDFWFRPALMAVRWPLIGLVVFAIAIEILRSMRWIERKDVLAIAYISNIVGIFALIIFLFNQQSIVYEARAKDRADAVAEADAAAQAKVEKEKTALAECELHRTAEVQKTLKHRADLRALLERCKDDFEKAKTIFTQDTLEQRCKSRQASLSASERAYEVAVAATCPPAAK